MGGVIWLLLQQQLPYTDVLAVLLIGRDRRRDHPRAGRAGRARGVFVALLSHQMLRGAA